MLKNDIKIYQLVKHPLGIEILPLDDRHALDDATASMYENLASQPHRHDHYVCFIVERGCLNFNVDFQNIDITNSTLLLSSPGQVHQIGRADDLSGWAVAFDATFVDEQARAVIEQSITKAALLQLDSNEITWLSGICGLIYSAIKEQKPATFHHQLIQTLLNALFYRITAIFQVQENERIQQYSSRSVEIAKTFHQLVRTHFIRLKKPSDYAAEMNITVSYLNDTIKAVTGFSVSYFIQQEVACEAQRLLFYTGKSVKEIAGHLGYEDYKYFIRLFHKITGSSPAKYRKDKSPHAG